MVTKIQFYNIDPEGAILEFIHVLCNLLPPSSENSVQYLITKMGKNWQCGKMARSKKQKEKVLEVGFEPTTVAFLSIASNDPEPSTTQAGHPIRPKL